MRSPLVKVPSLKYVLLNQLEKALLQNYEENAVCFTDFLQKTSNVCNAVDASDEMLRDQYTSIDWRQLPLKKKQNIVPILYTSALLQRLTALGFVTVNETPLAASEQFVRRLEQARAALKSKLLGEQSDSLQPPLSVEARLWLEFQIETHRPGWLAFRLTPAGVYQWLTHLSDSSPDASTGKAQMLQPRISQDFDIERSNQQAVELLWQAQYTHACCCRLLRQCPQQPLPDCEDENRSFQTFQARYSERFSGQSLLHTLVSTADDLFWIPYRWPTRQYLLLLKSVAPLCQSFERFCRTDFSGFTQHSSADSLQGEAMRSRSLTLIKATQKVLKVLLEERLGEIAPEQL